MAETFEICMMCQKEIREDQDYVDDYGIIVHKSCLDSPQGKNLRKYLREQYENDPMEANHG